LEFDGDITVDSSYILEIEPGVTIEFEPQTGSDRHKIVLDTASTLCASGINGSTITFRADSTADDSLLVGLWDWIECRKESACTLKYVDLRHADYGIRADSGATLAIENSSVDYCDHDGIRAETSDVSIRHCDIDCNGVYGVNLFDGQGNIDTCTFANNVWGGIRLEDTGRDVDLNADTVHAEDLDAGHYGIHLVRSDPDIVQCMVHGVGGTGIQCDSASPYIHRYTTIRDCDYGVQCQTHSNPVIDTTVIDSNGVGVQALLSSYPVLGDKKTGDGRYNKVYDNADYHVKNLNTLSQDPIMAEDNWWKDTLSDTIAVKIYGQVDYDPFLTIEPWPIDRGGGGQSALTGFMPFKTQFSQVRPNPFRNGTRMEYDLSERGPVSLRVYDVSGKRVMELMSEVKEPGRYSVSWDGRTDEGKRLAQGLYFCRFEAGDYTKTQKLVLLR
jgi:hypothetical protein